jgi:hypothetical protein
VWLHDLNAGGPLYLFSLFDTLPKFSLGVIRILPTDLDGLIGCELVLTVLGQEVILDVDKLSLLVDPLESMAPITVIVTPSLGSTMVTEEHHAGMVGFRGER